MRNVIASYPEVLAISFSYYAYEPRSVEDRRRKFITAREDFLNERYMEWRMGEAPPGHEVAIHSDVLVNGIRMHMPMVDMATAARAHVDKLRYFIGEEFYGKMVWYTSGRSYHGYGNFLITEDQWRQLMGLLLLVNQPHMEPIVDPRWIGHRLLAGYSALRWTINSGYYLERPSVINFNKPYRHR